MLLDQVISELCDEKGLLNIENDKSTGPRFPTTDYSIKLEKSSESENSSLMGRAIIRREKNGRGSQEKELKLPLESNAMICNSPQRQKLDSPSGSFRIAASIPFQWEEKPGKPKNPSAENPECVLKLPPIRQSGLYSHVGDRKSPRKMPNNLTGQHRVMLQGRPSKPISQVSKVPGPTGMEAYKYEFAKDFANSDLESIWEEEDEEELVELSKKTYSSQDFPDIHSRRSYDLICPETIEEYMLGLGSFADNRSRTHPLSKRAMISRSAELAPRRFHSPWMGFRSTELGLHVSDMKFLKMASTPCTDSPSFFKNSISDCIRASNSESPPALLANCLISVIEMSNAVPVEDFKLSDFKMQEENDMSMTNKKDCLENDGSWPSLVQKSLSGQLRSSQKYHQGLMRSQSVQGASPLYSLKRISSMVKKTVWNSQGSLSSEDKGLENSEEKSKTQNQNHMKDGEEYTDDEDDDDDGFSEYLSSPKDFNGAPFGQESECIKSSYCSFKDLIPLGPPVSNSGKEFLLLGSQLSKSGKKVMPLGRFRSRPSNISVTPVKDDCTNNVQRKYKDDVETKGFVEGMQAVKYKGSCEKHSKSTKPAKMQIFSVLLRNFMINCGFLSATAHANNSGLCRRNGTHTVHCIRKKQ
ncbi:hypothetical protein KI387_000401, partial [Taxus chinensis]